MARIDDDYARRSRTRMAASLLRLSVNGVLSYPALRKVAPGLEPDLDRSMDVESLARDLGCRAELDKLKRRIRDGNQRRVQV